VQGKQSDLSFVYPLAAHFLVLLGGTLTFGFVKKKNRGAKEWWSITYPL